MATNNGTQNTKGKQSQEAPKRRSGWLAFLVAKERKQKKEI